MYEQDYILRLIKEIIRTLIKLLTREDMEKSVQEFREEEQDPKILRLFELVDQGKICEAEDLLFEMCSGSKDKDLTRAAIYFYSYLNEQEEAYLQAHNFSHREIQAALVSLLRQNGLDEIADMYE